MHLEHEPYPGAEQSASSHTRLKANTIGPWGLAALAIGITSPALGLYAMWGPMQASAGPITPLIFLSAMVLTLPTGISYALLNRDAPSAGAASTWLWMTVSPAAGYQAGLLMATYFIMGVVCCPLIFALFFNDFLRLIHLPVAGMGGLYLGVAVATVPIAIASLQGAEASIKTTVRLMLAETIVVLALSITILMVKSAEPGGITLSPFNPHQASNGISGVWTAMILGVGAFCGFDVVSTAAEEAHAPKKHLPKAILLTIIGMGIFWAVTAWAFTLSTPTDEVVRDTQLGLPVVMRVAQNYWGWGSLLIILTAFTAITAVYVSIVLGASRIVFALARHRLAPSMFARLIGSRRVPRNAVLGVLACALLLDFMTLSLLRNGIDSYNWWARAVVFFATLTFMAVNLANGLYFFRFARSEFTVLNNVLVPLLGLALNGYLLYAAFFSALWSLDFRTGKSVVIACVILLAVELVIVLALRLFLPQRFASGAPLSAA